MLWALQLVKTLLWISTRDCWPPRLIARLFRPIVPAAMHPPLRQENPSVKDEFVALTKNPARML